jgi:hypothetical protein
MRAFEDPESLTAVLEHLRHKGESVETAVHVECREDFLSAPNLYPLVHA